MREKLKELLAVQEIDKSLASLVQKKEALPAELEAFNEAVKMEEAKKKSLEEENLNLVKERRQEERDLEAKNETRKKFQDQLYQVKTNKEYSALMGEINNIRNEIEKLEEEILVLMEKSDEVEKKLASGNDLIREKQEQLEEARKSNEEETARINGKLQEWEKKREEKVAHIPAELLSRYERIRRGRNGLGLVLVKNNACQGCFMELPPQVISEIKLGQRLIVCENCNRLLYLEV